jgi:hypothetical protein
MFNSNFSLLIGNINKFSPRNKTLIFNNFCSPSRFWKFSNAKWAIKDFGTSVRTIVNGNNTLEGEIRERIAKGNKACYVNKTLFKSNLVCRKSKWK